MVNHATALSRIPLLWRQADVFPVGTSVVYIGPNYYGAKGEVLALGPANPIPTATLKLTIAPSEKPFGKRTSEPLG